MSTHKSRIFRLPVFDMTVIVNSRGGAIRSSLTDAISPADPVYAAYSGLESMVLAHACAGIDVEDPAYLEGVETAFEAIENNLIN